MAVEKIVYVCLEDGMKIAEYESREPAPQVGSTIEGNTIGITGTFQIIRVSERPFVSGYRICELRVKEFPS